MKTTIYCLFWKAYLHIPSIRAGAVLLYEQSPEYHCEVAVVYDNLIAHMYEATRAHDADKHGVLSRITEMSELDKLVALGLIEMIPIPIKNIQNAESWLEQARNSPSTFLLPLWNFVLPESTIKILDPDIDNFMKPSTLKHLYCSKFVLLFLRECYWIHNLDNDMRLQQLLWSVNCNRCTPAYVKQVVQWVYFSHRQKLDYTKQASHRKLMVNF